MPRPSGGFTRLQHAAVKVHDIEAAKDFYVNTLGFTVSEIFEPGTVGDFPFGLCFMRCTEFHHDMNLIFWPEGEGPAPPEERSFFSLQTGLHHIAFEVEDRTQLAEWASYLEEKEVEIFWGPSIHSPTHPEGDGFWGENHALYIADPSGNCIEIFCDMAVMDPYTNRVNEEWFRDRLSRDGHPRDAAAPPEAWKA